jgi:nuclear transport factor 2 (NTF2) superfamily protein
MIREVSMAEPMTASAEIELVRGAYAAFNRREFETVLALMHSDVQWPNRIEGGYMVGPDAVREYWRRQFETLDSRVEPQAFSTEPDGRVAVRVHQVVRDKAGQVVVAKMVEHVYEFRNGLIASMEVRD